MTKMSIRGVSLNVKVFGHGYPLALMHGGPGADLYSMMAYKSLSDTFMLVFYDHRCNGRSTGADVSTMTWENLTADADALRQALGFDKWAVLGHSFGGHVALEYALRYSQSLSHLVLVDTGGESRRAHENVPKILAERGFSQETVNLSQRFYDGQIEPNEFYPTLMKLSKAYEPHSSLWQLPQRIGRLRIKLRPEARIFAARNYLQSWDIMDRLGEIRVPTLVMAGRDDFIFPPNQQEQLAAGIPNARLVIIDQAGHNVHDEQKTKAIGTVREFLQSENQTSA